MIRSIMLRRIVVATAIIAAPAYAMLHPRLVAAVPAVNSTASVAPTMLRLTFQEALEPAMSRITMVDSARRAVALGAVVADAADPKTLVATLKAPVGQGRYTVNWQAAGADGHPMRGSYTFTVAASHAH
ncbi:MAG: copper homeostasis periplasmic binding protein CopC [Gemmatimonadaceae bacterium]|nr:copper homeostasis periplasmic binding protein CopC [Gemmatimonadaceae bacterium]